MIHLLIKARKFLSYIPYLVVISFYSFVVRATIVIGDLPRYNNPDPGSLHFEKHTRLVEMSFDIAFIGIMLWLILGIASIFFKPLKLERRYNITFLIGIALIIYIGMLDPLGEWYWD